MPSKGSILEQNFPQAIARPVQPGFDSTQRHADKLLYFFEFIGFRVVQQHDHPVLVAELGEGRFEPAPLFAARHVCDRILATGQR